MNNKKEKLSVAEAEQEYQLKAFNIRRWIRLGKVAADKGPDGYLIHRASLETYINGNETPKVGSEPDPVAAAETSSGQSGKDERTSNEESPADFRAGAIPLGSNQRKGPQKRSTNEKPKVNRNVSSNQRHDKQHSHGKKSHGKGPVKFVKNRMRHMDVAQMLDVRDWLANRIIKKTIASKTR